MTMFGRSLLTDRLPSSWGWAGGEFPVHWYMPVFRAERLGKQTGLVVNAWVKSMPRAARLSECGVRTCACP